MTCFPSRPPPCLVLCRRGAAEKGGNPELVRESQRRRFADVGKVDKVVALDEEWRKGRSGGGRLRTRLPPHTAAAFTWQIAAWARPDGCPVPAWLYAVRYELDGKKMELNSISKEVGMIKKVRAMHAQFACMHLQRRPGFPTRPMPMSMPRSCLHVCLHSSLQGGRTT